MYRVLLIEDDPFVRPILEHMLRSRAYEVVAVSGCTHPENRDECKLRCYCVDSRPDAKPDLIVAAVVSPRECSGAQAAAKAIGLWDGVKVLFVSATTPDFWPPHTRSLLRSLPLDRCSFIAKPFSADALAASVAELLAR